jgi:hypothetical protein
MSSALCSALKSAGVPALLVAVGLVVASLPPGGDGIDPEAIEAASGRPSSLCPPETRGFRLPPPDAYPLEHMPWIESREDFVAYYTRGEDPEVVRRYVAGPEEELIGYLGEVFRRSGYPGLRGLPPVATPPDLALGPPGR